jgi:outer membrane biosynthesis protein TonB
MKKMPGSLFGWFLLAILALVPGTTEAAKKAAHFVPPSVLTTGAIQYPPSSTDAGMVTLSINLDETGHVANVVVLRDIPSVSGLAIASLQSWTYSAATLDGKPVASNLTVNILYDPGFLGADSIPLPPPAQSQPITKKGPAYTAPQLNTANFAPYPPNAKTQGAVIFNVTLDTNGNAVNIATLREVPSLTASGLSTLKQWSFGPATYDGNPIQSSMLVAFVFRSPSAPLP